MKKLFTGLLQNFKNFFWKIKNLFVTENYNLSSMKNIKIAYKNKLSWGEKRKILLSNNMVYEDTIQLEKSSNMLNDLESYINNTFNKFKNFYLNWNEISDIKNLFTKEINIMYFFGNNGIGKTTSIVNLGKILKSFGYKIMIIAADEFRGGAVEQLEQMCNLHNIECYSSKNYEKEVSLSQIIFDGINHGINERYKVILIDTAGRSHNDINLIDNLKKQQDLAEKIIINKSMDKESISNQSVWVNDGNIVNVLQNQKSLLDKIPFNYVIITKIKENCGYYNLLNILSNYSAPIILYSPNKEELRIFNKNEFLKNLS